MIIENLTDDPLMITVDGETEVVLAGDHILVAGDEESTISVEVYNDEEQDVELGYEELDTQTEG